VKSLTNFAAMTGGIAAAWGGAQSLWGSLCGLWFPFVLCVLFGVVSLVASRPGARVKGLDGKEAPDRPSPVVRWLQPSFIALVNTFVLYGAVLGTGLAIRAA
jgi:hypothetical protein